MSHKDVIRDAIQNFALLSLVYKNSARVVEPHLLGITGAGNLALSAFQVSAPSGTGFRLFIVDEIEAIESLDASFEGPREGYNPNDKAMVQVLFSL